MVQLSQHLEWNLWRSLLLRNAPQSMMSLCGNGLALHMMKELKQLNGFPLFWGAQLDWCALTKVQTFGYSGLYIYLEYIARLDSLHYLWRTLFFTIFLTESKTRLTDPDYARGYKTMFSDGFPFLIASQVLFANVTWFPDKRYLQMLLNKNFTWQCKFVFRDHWMH